MKGEHKNTNLDAIAEMWVNLVLNQVQAKNLQNNVELGNKNEKEYEQ